jgi:hypothetical protein
MSITHTHSEIPTQIVNRPLENVPLSQLVSEVEADYNEGTQVRFDVLSELILRAEAAEATQ